LQPQHRAAAERLAGLPQRRMQAAVAQGEERCA
jgi:hypothetical protein